MPRLLYSRMLFLSIVSMHCFHPPVPELTGSFAVGADPPTFIDPHEERKYIKERLALAYREC